MNSYISVEDALGLILEHVRPMVRHKNARLEDALGRVLAKAIKAPADAPPYARAAMDGYAFRAADTPGTLRVVGTLFAGDAWPGPVGPGEALRIMTGAPIPEGLDTVLEQERVRDGQKIRLEEPVALGRNIMQQAHEYAKGTEVLALHTLLTPIRLGQLASMGAQEVAVLEEPRVLLLVTGDEVEPDGKALRHGQVYDTNGPLLRALLSAQGVQVTLRHVVDQVDRIMGELEIAAHESYDMVLTTGGVSVGQRDYLPELLRTRFQRLFWHVNMHPGKATAAGVLDGDVPIVALSGNPGAALTAWYLIVSPVVAALREQRHPLRPVCGQLLGPYPKPSRETRYLKAHFDTSIWPIGFDIINNQSSDALLSFAEADGMVVIPSGSPPQSSGQILDGFWLPGLAAEGSAVRPR